MSEQLDGIDADFATAGRTIERLEAENATLETALRQLLVAAMPIRADKATLQDVARAIPELYDACHSAAITLNFREQLDAGSGRTPRRT